MDINKVIHGILDKLEKSNSFYLPETAIIYLLDHIFDFRELVDEFIFYDTWESIYEGGYALCSPEYENTQKDNLLVIGRKVHS